METKIKNLKDFIEKYKNEILIPLAKEGLLTKDLCYEAIDVYIEQLEEERRKSKDIAFLISKEGEFQSLHPFHEAPFMVAGKEYGSVIHYYWSSKFAGSDEEFSESLRTCKTPQVAHRRGLNGGSSHKVREDWDQIKKNEVRKAYQASLATHAESASLLKRITAEKIIIKPCVDDTLGVDKDGKGENLAGLVLSELKVGLK